MVKCKTKKGDQRTDPLKATAGKHDTGREIVSDGILD